MPKNAKCHVSDSELCRWLDKDCGDCYINGIKDQSETEKMLSDFQVMLSLLPEDFDTLQGSECCFCLGDVKKPRAGYAVVDLAHNEPEHKRGMFFGMGKKVRQRIGSLLPVSISICKDCRRALRMADYIKWLVTAATVAVAVGLCFIPAINAVPALPYGVVIAGFLAGYLLSKVASAAYVKAKSAQTAFNVFEIPICKKMEQAGWFTMQDMGSLTRYIMSRKSYTKLMSGLCAAEEQTAAGEIEKAAAAKD